MKYVDFFGDKISKIVLGDNSMTGHSYIEDAVPGKDMLNFYKSEKIKETLRYAESLGVNTMLPLSHPYMIRVLQEHQEEGGNMQLIWQPYLLSVRELWPVLKWDLMKLNTIGIYHQGTTTDLNYENGKIDTIKENIKMLRELGVPVGLGTHYPEVIELAEEEDWGADFYLACMQNARRGRVGEPSGFLTGKTKSHIVFYPEDRPVMLETLKYVKKPVGVFKIFAGGQMLLNKSKEERENLISGVYEEIFSELKPDDFAMMGVFQRDEDELGMNIRLFDKWAESRE